MKRERIAIIGTGISGLACAHFLHPHHDITVYEKDDRIGGHSHTVTVSENGRDLPLDTGFMVYNEVTYPLLTRLFSELDVKTKPTSMSFSVCHADEGVEFNGGSLNLLFGQRKNLLRPRFWRMLMRIDRFNKETVQELKEPQYGEITLEEYVKIKGYGEDFLQWYLVPMAAAVWSSPPERIRGFPAKTLMRFWYNHGFLGLDTQHPWRTVEGGSIRYVEKLIAPFRHKIRCHSQVKGVTSAGQVILADGSTEEFDRVIMAAHGDQSLRMIGDPSPLELEILGAFHYQDNHAVVHVDTSVMPQIMRCWASWNYRIDQGRHSTHYWMNSLQGVSNKKNYFVSINSSALRKSCVIHRLKYEHPLFDLKAAAMQTRLPELHEAGQETRRYYCGAWQRYGFHEDGLWSAFRLCTHLLGKEPWS